MLNKISFETTKEEDVLIEAIVNRSDVTDRLLLTMDLSGCHANGCPLDFKKLLEFDDFSFYHDIWGIRRNLNRTTGKLENCFVPRCAQ